MKNKWKNMTEQDWKESAEASKRNMSIFEDMSLEEIIRHSESKDEIIWQLEEENKGYKHTLESIIELPYSRSVIEKMVKEVLVKYKN